VVAVGQSGSEHRDVMQLDPSDLSDSNGAGDAFVGGFLAQWMKLRLTKEQLTKEYLSKEQLTKDDERLTVEQWTQEQFAKQQDASSEGLKMMVKDQRSSEKVVKSQSLNECLMKAGEMAVMILKCTGFQLSQRS
jgi:hypothetical protein